MPQFYGFPTSCAVQVFGSFGDGRLWPEQSLEQPRLTTLVVLSEWQDINGNASKKLKALGFRRLGKFNQAHSQEKGTLSLWVAGGEFVPDKGGQ